MTHLSFPFRASWTSETGPLEAGTHDVTVLSLGPAKDWGIDEWYGLMCEVRLGRRKVVLPLGELELADVDGPHAQLLEDYAD